MNIGLKLEYGNKLELVNSTGSRIGKLLFNRNLRSEVYTQCNSFCIVCKL